MVKAAEDSQEDTSVYDFDTSSDNQSRTSRRGFVLGAVGLVAAGAAVGAKFTRGGGGQGSIEESEALAGSEEGERDPNDRTVSAAEAEASIDSLSLPDFYEDRPWADPTQLFGLEPEQLAEIASPPTVAEAGTNEALTESIRQKSEAIANAGRTVDDFRQARELNYPVGEQDRLGNKLGNYPEYVRTQYMDFMVNGLFSESKDSEVNAGFSGYFAGWAKEFEYTLTDPRWHDHATVLIDAALLDSQYSAFTEEDTLTIGLTVGRPVVEGDWKDAPNAHTGTMAVVAKKVSNQYSLRLQSIDVG